MIIFYLFLLLHVGCCSDEQIFETKTVHVGENINLTCTRRDVGTLFWIKLVSGNFPKILGRSFSSQSDDQRIRTATQPETFVLYIKKAQQSDAGFYICMKTANRDLTFLNGIYLKVEGPHPVFTTTAPSDPVHQQHTVILQCSVLHDFQNKTCSADHSVFCLSAESHQSHACIHVTDGDKYEKNSEGLSTKKCFYINFSSSHSQTYYCVVVTCVESGDKTEDNTEVNKSDPKKNNTLYLLGAALVSRLIVTASLVYSIKKLKNNSYVYSDAAVTPQANETAHEDQEIPQTDEDPLVYSVAIFTCGKIRPSRGRPHQY